MIPEKFIIWRAADHARKLPVPSLDLNTINGYLRGVFEDAGPATENLQTSLYAYMARYPQMVGDFHALQKRHPERTITALFPYVDEVARGFNGRTGTHLLIGHANKEFIAVASNSSCTNNAVWAFMEGKDLSAQQYWLLQTSKTFNNPEDPKSIWNHLSREIGSYGEYENLTFNFKHDDMLSGDYFGLLITGVYRDGIRAAIPETRT